MLGASLLTFALVRLYTRLARRHRWPSGRIGDVHVHHMVVGVVIVLATGMIDIAFDPGDNMTRKALAVVVRGRRGVHPRRVRPHLPPARRLLDARGETLDRRLHHVAPARCAAARRDLAVRRPRQDRAAARDRFRGDRRQHRALARHLPQGQADARPREHLRAADRARHSLQARPSGLDLGAALLHADQKQDRAEARFDPDESQLERMRIRVVDLVAGAPDR